MVTVRYDKARRRFIGPLGEKGDTRSARARVASAMYDDIIAPTPHLIRRDPGTHSVTFRNDALADLYTPEGRNAACPCCVRTWNSPNGQRGGLARIFCSLNCEKRMSEAARARIGGAWTVCPICESAFWNIQPRRRRLCPPPIDMNPDWFGPSPCAREARRRRDRARKRAARQQEPQPAIVDAVRAYLDVSTGTTADELAAREAISLDAAYALVATGKAAVTHLLLCNKRTTALSVLRPGYRRSCDLNIDAHRFVRRIDRLVATALDQPAGVLFARPSDPGATEMRDRMTRALNG